MENLAQLKALLSSPKRIVITSHANPDGDAIGSTLALYHHLIPQQHYLSVIVPNPMPDFLEWLPESEDVLVYENTTAFSDQLIAQADIIFILDYNNLARVEEMEAPIAANQRAVKVMIDHHLSPTAEVDFMLSDTTASSTCELVYDFIQKLDQLEQLNYNTIHCLYTGILTDTGSFRHATSPKLFRIVADLNERGVDNTRIQDLLFNTSPEKRLRLLGFCLYKKLEVLEDCRVGIIALSQEDYKEFNIQRGDLEGVVNYILTLKVVQCAALITERRQIVKLSLRSKGDFSVQKIASKYFSGGGHRNASGGKSDDSLEETVTRFKTIIRSYKNELIKNESLSSNL